MNKLNSVSDLKRALAKGAGVKLVFAKIGFASNKSRLNKLRYVVKTQGNGVYLNEDKEAANGSFLGFPKASLSSFEGNTFSIHEAGYRDLTKEEKEVKAGEPRDKKQQEIDLMTDGSQMFWRRKAYYKEHNMNYLFHKDERGLHYNYNQNKIRDDSIKGDLLLKYEVLA